MMTSRPNMIHPLAVTLAAGCTTSIASAKAALKHVGSHHAADGTTYVSIDEQAVLAMAHATDVAHTTGNVPSLLTRLPVSIKDLFDVAGQVTTTGSRVLADQPHATADMTAITRLHTVGAMLLGRTNMSKFVFSGLGLNPHYGTPCALTDGTRVAGDSTSGDAITVAGGTVVAALGTDVNGSTRVPSALCSLTGFKPTAHHVPMAGSVPLSTSLDSGNPPANLVDCCAAVDAMLDGEPGDDTSDTATASLAGLRFGVTQNYIGAGLDSTVATAFDRAVEQLERAGAHIVRFESPELLQLPEINNSGGFSAAEFRAWHRSLLTYAEAQYSPRVATRICRGNQMNATAYIDMISACVRMIAAARRCLGNFDAWLMSVTAIMPPEVAPLRTDDMAFFRVNTFALRNPSVINFLDDYAPTLPVHAAGELPAGLSLYGLANNDAHILRVDRAVEAALRR